MIFSNRKFFAGFMSTVLLVLAAGPLAATPPSVASFNAEWFWDHLEPEGRIVGDSLPIPSVSTYSLEVSFWASAVSAIDADIVGFVEIEGRHVLQDVADIVGPDYYPLFISGRDTYTGQDVGLLVRSDFALVGKHNFESYWGDTGVERVRPSKALAVELARNGTSYGVVVTHLLSQRAANDDRRLAQAYAIRDGVLDLCGQTDECIVLGDLNSELTDPEVQHILGNNDSGLPLVSEASPNDYSYTYRGEQALIDHILVSDGLAGGVFGATDVPAEFSDHRAVYYFP